MVYFTADMYFGYRGIITMQNRPFESVEEMDYNERNRAEGIKRYDVGVDANNFFPVSVKQVIDFFERMGDPNDTDTL